MNIYIFLFFAQLDVKITYNTNFNMVENISHNIISNIQSTMAATTFKVNGYWFVIGYGRSPDSRVCSHVLSSERNTCLSIGSLVPVITFRCHFFVAYYAYHSLWPLMLGYNMFSHHMVLHPRCAQ